MSNAVSTPESGGLSRIPFTVAAENQIKSLSFWLAVLGWINGIAAAVDLSNLVFQRNMGQVVNLIIHVAVATWALQASTSFKKVAVTDTADQAYLVQGFARLRSLFLLQGLLVIVALAFIAAALLFVVLLAAGTH